MDRATYTLPNKHYIPVDMKYIGIDNTSPFQSCPSFLGICQGANVLRNDTGLSRRCSCRFRLQGAYERQKGGVTKMVTSLVFLDLSSGLISATVARVGASS